MNPKGRAELIGVGALMVGLFLGLTLLPWPLTGGLGKALGAYCWQYFGVGALLLPVLGIGWALAAFGRLGSLTTGRAGVLVAGLIVLVPYAIAIVGQVDLVLPADYLLWTTSQHLVGIIPGWLPNGGHHPGRPAGGRAAGLVRVLGARDSHDRVASVGGPADTRDGRRETGDGEVRTEGDRSNRSE